MSDPTIVACAKDVWTKVATAVTSARIYVGASATTTTAPCFLMTYRTTGGAAPVGAEGVRIPISDRDDATPSYRAEHGEPVDIYVMATGSAGQATVHAPVGGSVRETQPASVVNDVAIVAAPGGGINVPSDDGIVMDGYEGIGFQIYALGGQTNAHANRTVTVTFQVSNDVTVAAARRWVPVSVGYDLGTDTTAATWQSVGLTARDAAVDFDNLLHKRIRVNYTFDAAPEADHPGAVVITERRK